MQILIIESLCYAFTNRKAPPILPPRATGFIALILPHPINQQKPDEEI